MDYPHTCPTCGARRDAPNAAELDWEYAHRKGAEAATFRFRYGESGTQFQFGSDGEIRMVEEQDQ